MTCNYDEKLINAYADKQLDAANMVEVEQHISSCKECDYVYQNIVSLKNAVNKHAEIHSAPEHVREKILGDLHNIPDHQITTIPPLARSRTFYFLAAASLLFITVFVGSFFHHHLEEEKLINNLLSSHVNAINANRLTDIQSTRVEQLYSWFTQKLDFSPKLVDISSEGLQLLGGRLDTLEKQRVAAITYKLGHHIVNVYTWPSPEKQDAIEEAHSKQGYQVVYWCNDYMNYWIVSDANKSTILDLAKHIQNKLTDETKKH